jgi:hypothetical protein
MSRNRNRGKALERYVAKDLGGRRVGILGQEDVSAHGFSIECKERNALPRFLVDCMNQAERNARGDVAVVVLHELQSDHGLDYVILRYKHFREILGRLKEDT